MCCQVLDKYISAAGSSEGGAFLLGSRFGSMRCVCHCTPNLGFCRALL